MKFIDYVFVQLLLSVFVLEFNKKLFKQFIKIINAILNLNQ